MADYQTFNLSIWVRLPVELLVEWLYGRKALPAKQLFCKQKSGVQILVWPPGLLVIMEAQLICNQQVSVRFAYGPQS